jgi:hypothetical protein
MDIKIGVQRSAGTPRSTTNTMTVDAVREARGLAPIRAADPPDQVGHSDVASGKQVSLEADAGTVALARYCPSSSIASEKLTLSENLAAVITDRQAAVAR